MIFFCSSTAQVNFALYKKVLHPFCVSHGPLYNRMIEDDFCTSTSCVLNHDLANVLSMLALAGLQVHLLDSVGLRSLLLAIPVVQLHCVQLRASTLLDHKTQEKIEGKKKKKKKRPQTGTHARRLKKKEFFYKICYEKL